MSVALVAVLASACTMFVAQTATDSAAEKPWTAKLIAVRPNLVFPPPGQPSTAVLGPFDTTSHFEEAIVSWNVANAESANVLVQARAVSGDYKTKWYTMGDWSADTKLHPRVSVDDQKDADGTVLTDTLRVSRPFSQIELSVTLTNLGAADSVRPVLKFVSVCVSGPSESAEKEEADTTGSPAWGREIDVPTRAQNNYPNGGVLCSPTSVSMLMSHYSKTLGRPELDLDVPEVQAGVWDSIYKGAGNWPFNTAYAGSFSGMKAYVARFDDLSNLEQWIAAGFPVICSVSFDLLRGKALSPTEQGHLIVLTGFTKEGDPIVNDPAFKDSVRKSYPRADFRKAWDYSKRTVYLIYPESADVPPSPKELWDAG